MSLRDIIFKRYEPILVTGWSMNPTLVDMDLVIIDKKLSSREKLVERGIYVVYDDKGKICIKRLIKENKKKREIWVQGDNMLISRDSRTYGWLPKDNIIGKVVLAKTSKCNRDKGDLKWRKM